MEKKQQTTKEEAEFHKWVGVIERTPSYFRTKADLKVNGVPKELWDKLSEVCEPVKEALHQNPTPREAFRLIKDIIDYYLDMPEDKKTIIALWIIGTYLHDRFESFPYLFLNAMRGSGKTRTLKLITALAKDGQMLMSLTEAGLFRTSGTLGIDEFESLGSKEKQPLREMLNASYKKGIKIVRMKKKKTIEGENQEAEYFEPYRPIAMANIWGIEEVLGDRSISIVLEKSNNPMYTKIMDNFENDSAIFTCKKAIFDSLVYIVNEHTAGKHIHTLAKWNTFVKNLCSLHTLNTYSTYNTLYTPTAEEEELFQAICDTEVDGRNLELYFPLFIIANHIGKDILLESLEIAKSNIQAKKLDDIIESKDITVYTLVAGLTEGSYHSIKDITNTMLLLVGDNMENRQWLNPKWMGSALKRLNLIIDKRRMGNGIEVTLNIKKAQEKMEMFK